MVKIGRDFLQMDGTNPEFPRTGGTIHIRMDSQEVTDVWLLRADLLREISQ